MKKLLFQLDTDDKPAVFDTVVAYDGGADHVIGYGSCTPDNVMPLVEGAIFTRAPKEKKNTALFVGGSDMNAGEALFKAVQNIFFADFRVSIMLDSNGSNTTAAAGVAKLIESQGVAGKKVLILAGTGPVGRRAATMMALEGADVALTSRKIEKAEKACQDIKASFNVNVTPLAAADCEACGEAAKDAQIIFAGGAAGVELLLPEHWQHLPHLEAIADANATPPLGIGGTEMFDRGKLRHDKVIWGAIGFGALKLEIHRTCIKRLFTRNDQVFDLQEILSLAKEIA